MRRNNRMSHDEPSRLTNPLSCLIQAFQSWRFHGSGASVERNEILDPFVRFEQPGARMVLSHASIDDCRTQTVSLPRSSYECRMSF